VVERDKGFARTIFRPRRFDSSIRHDVRLAFARAIGALQMNVISCARRRQSVT
jgi:hypothetical protein